MHTKWSDFFERILGKHPILAELDTDNGLVTGVTVRSSGQLFIYCDVQYPCPPELLCQLEASLEEALGTSEVIVCQNLKNALPDAQASVYAASLAPWLLRHLCRHDAFAASLLRQAEFRSSEDSVGVHLQDACCTLLGKNGLSQLPDLCRRFQQIHTRFQLVPIRGELGDYTRKLEVTASRKANAARIASASMLSVSDADCMMKSGSTGESAHSGYAAGRGNKPPKTPQQRRTIKTENQIWGRTSLDLTVSSISTLNSESGVVMMEGQTFDLEFRPVSQGTRLLVKFALTDQTSSIQCIVFAKPEEEEHLRENLENASIRVQAEISFDSQYAKDLRARVIGIQKAKAQSGRQDQADPKRVELHCHTKMSTKDAVCDAASLVRLAAKFGHRAVAVTDHGVVQSFPEACNTRAALKKKGQDIKILYGLEGYLVDDGNAVCWGYENASTLKSFVSLDVETTGLNPDRDRVIEIAALRYQLDDQGVWQNTDRFVTFVDPGIDIPAKITELTGIHKGMLKDAAEPFDAITQLSAFIGDIPVVAHNAFFDLGFLRYEGFRTRQTNDPRVKFNMPLIDTLAMARVFLPDLNSHKLNLVAEALQIELGRHHRAEDDARTCAEIFVRLLAQSGCSSLDELNSKAGHASDEEILAHKKTVFHVILLAKDALGLYNLYRLISASHIRYFHSRPRIPRYLLQFFRHGILVGGACEAGEIYQKVLSAYQQTGADYAQTLARLEQPDILKTVRFYDYLEIQPISNNQFYLRDPHSGLQNDEDLRQINRLIVDLGKRWRKPVCATCDVHFLEPRDQEFRRILMMDMGYEDAHQQPELYFRTTGEMLTEFQYLGETTARQVVIENPQAIADRVDENLKPFPDGSFPPIIPSAADDVRTLTWDTAKAMYGYRGVLPEQVRSRVERELDSIIDNGFAIMYYIAHRLVKKSNEDGYIVGSRGSVGSSLVATFCGITEVNPLPPHYVCPRCHFSEFDQTGNFGSGYDLPPRDCPDCRTPLHREGQDIPFETFLGFNGDKQPDIDLNFSGEYQPRAHRFIEEMFGSSHTFRAGTIGSFAEKNAQAIVRSHFEEQNQFATQAEMTRLARGLIGVKRTTGQHPGGIVVVPKERDIFDFTPIQHPADKRDGGTITTHFDFNAMHDTILKLDILGHDDPTMLKMLGDLTGTDVNTIPIPDEKVMSLFTSTEALGIPAGTSPVDAATLGLPEMGTFMARDMIRETRPSRFFDLVQLMGLSHGTDVWKGNAQDLIRSGTCTINEVIGCRDSIMTWLIYNGLPSKAAFDIMEKVRKGKGLSQEHEQLMVDHKIPQWYIDSCKKIKYMFPKAHAAAYTISSLRIAWFKVYHPEAYYCAYFTVRADEFDSSIMCRPAVEIRIDRERRRQSFRDASDREQKIYYILELVEEMQLRGIEFLPIDLYRSDPVRFKIEGSGQIRPPLNAIPGISTAIGESIAGCAAAGPFKSKDEMMRRCGIGAAAIETLTESGCLNGLPDSAQIDLFGLM